MGEGALFGIEEGHEAKRNLGSHLVLELRGHKAILYRHDVFIKEVGLSDRVATRLFVVEVVELGANQSRLAEALGISRQTIHNYREIKKHFGLEGNTDRPACCVAVRDGNDTTVQGRGARMCGVSGAEQVMAGRRRAHLPPRDV